MAGRKTVVDSKCSLKPTIIQTLLKESVILIKLIPWLLVAVAVGLLLRKAAPSRKAQTLPDGSIEFAPSKRAYVAHFLFSAYGIYGAVISLLNPRSLASFVTAALFILPVVAYRFPEKIVVTHGGLSQRSFLRSTKHVHWSQVIEINLGKNRSDLTITGSDGTKIVHTSLLPDRPRLLQELKQHCQENLPSDFPPE